MKVKTLCQLEVTPMVCRVGTGPWWRTCVIYRGFVHRRKWCQSACLLWLLAHCLTCVSITESSCHTGVSLSAMWKRGERPWPELTSCFCWGTFRNVDDCINICSEWSFYILLRIVTSWVGRHINVTGFHYSCLSSVLIFSSFSVFLPKTFLTQQSEVNRRSPPKS